MNSKFSKRNYIDKANYYLEIIANCPDYIGRNYSVEEKIIYKNEFVTENKQIRVEVCKRFLKGSENIVMYLITFYDNNFNPYKIECQEILKQNPHYKGIIYSFDFVQNIHDKYRNEILELMNRMQIVNQNVKNNYMLIPRRIGNKKYINTIINFDKVSNFYQHPNAPFYPINLVKMHVAKSNSVKSLNKEFQNQYKYRNFEQELDFYFTEYEFYWKFLNMLAQAYNAQG